MTDLALSQAIADGDRLTTHRGVDYVRVAAVFALPIDPAQPPQFYALERDWPSTPIGEIAARERMIVQLQRQVETLQAELAAAKAAPTLLPAPEAPEAPPAELPCPYCSHAGFRSERALNVHLGRMHAGQWVSKRVSSEPAPAEVAEPAPPMRPTLLATPDDPTWSCSSCGKRPGVDGAFSRSVGDPALCLKCAAKAKSTRPAAQIAA